MRKTLFAAAALAAFVVLSPALAVAADETRPHSGGFIQADWLKGRPIVNAQGKEMGKIEEVWLDPADTCMKEVVVGAGGFLGIGDKQSVLPWKAVQILWSNQKLVVQVNEQALRAAQTRDRSRQPAASPR